MFSAAEKAALQLCDAMCRTPAEVPDAVVAALKLHFDSAQIVEITATIAWENFRSRFNRGLGIGSDGFSEGSFCVLPVRHAPPPPPATA